MKCIHSGDPLTCKKCNNPKSVLLGWKKSENDQLTTDDYYRGNATGYSKKDNISLK